MKYTVRSEEKHVFELPRKTELNTDLEVKFKNRNVNVRILETGSDGSIRLVMVDNRVIPVQVDRRSDSFPERVWVNGVSYAVNIEKVESVRYKAPATPKIASGEVRAELPGVVTALFVAQGDEVEAGQPLGILEAMKMENEISAPRAGKVKAIVAETGQAVMKNDLILEIA